MPLCVTGTTLNHKMPDSTMISNELPVCRSSTPFTIRTAVRISRLTCITFIVGSMLSDAALSYSMQHLLPVCIPWLSSHATSHKSIGWTETARTTVQAGLNWQHASRNYVTLIQTPERLGVLRCMDAADCAGDGGADWCSGGRDPACCLVNCMWAMMLSCCDIGLCNHAVNSVMDSAEQLKYSNLKAVVFMCDVSHAKLAAVVYIWCDLPHVGQSAASAVLTHTAVCTKAQAQGSLHMQHTVHR